jgi:hypothetical protein
VASDVTIGLEYRRQWRDSPIDAAEAENDRVVLSVNKRF